MFYVQLTSMPYSIQYSTFNYNMYKWLLRHWEFYLLAKILYVVAYLSIDIKSTVTFKLNKSKINVLELLAVVAVDRGVNFLQFIGKDLSIIIEFLCFV